MIHINQMIIPEDKHTHIAVVQKKKKSFLYFNGEKISRVKSFDETVAWILKNYYPEGITIGIGDNAKSYTCWIREKRVLYNIRVYNRKLNEVEIMALFNSCP